LNMEEYAQIASNPVFFERNRVFRVYKGGKLFHDFFGDDGLDGNYPEEWIASGVKALNSNPQTEHEGISMVRGSKIRFDWLLTNFKEIMLGERKNFDVLVKILDSAIRLPAQAHPDKAFSRNYFKSEYGKTEMWIILATRDNAKIYFGFREGVTRDDLISAIGKSENNKNIMASLMNEIPARKGEVYLIPAKMVHAIGYGCLILEVQEPTDFTIQPEAWCGEYHLNEFEMYLGVKKEQALECFDFSVSGYEAVKLGRKQPVVFDKSEGVSSETLVSYNDTACFSVNRHMIAKGSLILKNAPSVYIITEGAGILENEAYRQPVKKGEYFFLPFAAKGKCIIKTDHEIELIECLPSLVQEKDVTERNSL
jgi:mannose-6-phosphate isomerase